MSRRLRRSGDAALWAGIAAGEAERLLAGEHAEPHRLLGAHPAGRSGVVVRAHHPDARSVDCVLEGGQVHAMSRMAAPGLFGALLPDAKLPLRYRLRFRFGEDGDAAWERDDPYRFLPTLGELDLHLFGEGTHRRLWEMLGARERIVDGTPGTAFAVWAPNARRVSVVGDFCAWDGRVYPMRSLGSSGIFELFVPEVGAGTLYKFEILTRERTLRVKADPMAREAELPPGTASRVNASSYAWGDGDWLAERARRDPLREPMSIYEVHLGSWQRVPEEDNRVLSYRELAPRLVEHAHRFGFTHLELLPISEHPFSGSWGYQVSCYYAPTARYGTPDDFRFFVDHCHRNGVGVILDWVPAHFPRDDFALRLFDGTALYEHADPRRGEHPDWGTLIFNYGRREVRNFLVANALYWLSELHVDGLRVDAVASMLYLDYSRREGEWIPNERGGRENLDATLLMKELNGIVAREHPGCVTIAEESTDWQGVTRPVQWDGLGFTFKWNMGWMHDTLEYFGLDPLHRRWHQDDLTFAMHYEYDEHFLMPLSHDEVVHGKGSLLARMPGDEWQRFANLRLLLAYQRTRPGKKLVFMGSELGPDTEWNHDASLDWHRADEPARAGLARFLEELGRLYRELPALWRWDHDPCGFQWIDCTDRENSVLAFLRWDGDAHVVVVLNLTPVSRGDYRIGVPGAGRYRERLSSDATHFGGSGYATDSELFPEPTESHGFPQSLRLRLPPLSALVLAPDLR